MDPIKPMFTEEQVARLNRAFNQIVTGFREALENVGRMMKVWFPVVSSAHRETVRTVRTQYRRKQKARRRRGRKR